MKYSPGQYQARVAASGFFGTGLYSKVIQFNVINGTSPNLPNGDGKNSNNPMVPGASTENNNGATKAPPKKATIRFTAVPELLEPKTGDKVIISDTFFEWTQVKNANAYKLELMGDSSEEFELTKSSCKDCKAKAPGPHKVKVAAIIDGKVGEWGPEVTFDIVVTSTLSGTKIINPLDKIAVTIPIEIAWLKIDNAKTYVLYIMTIDRPVKVQTWLNFYTVWHFRNVGKHVAKVHGLDKNSDLGPWSPEIRFEYVVDQVFGRGRWENDQWTLYRPYKPSKHRPSTIFKLNFQPVSGDWMNEKCRELSHLNCEGDSLHRPQKNESFIFNFRAPKANTAVPSGSNNFYAAISLAITNKENKANEIRELVCQEVESNAEEHGYLIDGINVNTYVNDHRRNKKPTAVEISAPANILKTTIWIFGYWHPSTWIDFQPRAPKYNESIFLIYTRANDHFDIVFDLK